MTDTTNPILNAFPEPVRAAASVYGGVLTRLASADMVAAVVASQKNDAQSAAQTIVSLRKNMTPEELAEEKVALAGLAEIMAKESYEARLMALSILKAALAVAFTGVGL